MLVSIYLPTKNREALLRRVESVLMQSYTTLELVVVDDGSTDGTHRYLDTVRTADSRIRVIRKETSLGAPLSRNLFSQDVTERGSERFATARPRFRPLGRSVLQQCHWQSDLHAPRDTDCGRTIRSGDACQAGSRPIHPRSEALGPCEAGRCRTLPRELRSASRQDLLWIERQDSPRLSHARCEMQDCPRLMRQALNLQTFRHYGIKPGPLDLLAFVRMGLHLRTLKTLAGINLRKA